MKLGADLIAAGDIATARMMFERAAEAGHAAGAFGRLGDLATLGIVLWLLFAPGSRRTTSMRLLPASPTRACPMSFDV